MNSVTAKALVGRGDSRNGALQPKRIATAKVPKWKQPSLSTWGGTRWNEMGVAEAEEFMGASGVYGFKIGSDAENSGYKVGCASNLSGGWTPNEQEVRDGNRETY